MNIRDTTATLDDVNTLVAELEAQFTDSKTLPEAIALPANGCTLDPDCGYPPTYYD